MILTRSEPAEHRHQFGNRNFHETSRNLVPAFHGRDARQHLQVTCHRPTRDIGGAATPAHGNFVDRIEGDGRERHQKILSDVRQPSARAGDMQMTRPGAGICAGGTQCGARRLEKLPADQCHAGVRQAHLTMIDFLILMDCSGGIYAAAGRVQQQSRGVR